MTTREPWSDIRVAPHVRLEEVVCPHTRQGMVTHRTLALFEALRAAHGSNPLVILSGYRSPDHNTRVGGNPQSAHLTGEALDLAWPAGVDREEFLRICEELVGSGGLGRYAWGVHVDTRTSPPRRRWAG